MISATTWVPRGFASEFPEKYVLDDEEMARIDKMADLHLDDREEDDEEAKEKVDSEKLKDTAEVDDDLKEYDFEHYDEEPDNVFLGQSAEMFPGISNTGAKLMNETREKSGENEEEGEGEEEVGQDKYLQLPTKEDVLEQKQEFQVYPTDNQILATRTDDGVSYLDVYIYDDGAGAPAGSQEEEADKQDPDVARGMVRGSSLYIHHDLMLPNFPLCVEWLSFQPQGEVDASNTGNFAAVGTMDPTIEIWNLDCVDKAFPDVILGDMNEAELEKEEEEKQRQKTKTRHGKKSKKSKKSGKKVLPDRHTGAVLSLSHNHVFRNVLASSSADSTVKLWDLSTCGVARSIDGLHHGREVSSTQWYGTESEEDGSVLLTGGYDSYCAVSDVRIDDVAQMSKLYRAGSNGEEVEAVCWKRSSGKGANTYFYAGTDQGNVYFFDIRKEDKPVWSLHAHDSGITSLTCNPYLGDMLVTGAMGDKQVKLWKTAPKPSMVTSRNLDCGNVLSACFAPDIEVAGDLVVGGSTPGLKMWDCFSNRYVRRAFKDELKAVQTRARKEAQAAGRASRIARKYVNDDVKDVVFAVDEDEDEEDEEEEEK